MHVSLSASIDKGDKIDVSFFEKFSEQFIADVPNCSEKVAAPIPIKEALETLLAIPSLHSFFIAVSKADVFSEDAAISFSSCKEHLHLLRSFKLLKYCYNLPCGQLTNLLASVIAMFNEKYAKDLYDFSQRVRDDPVFCGTRMRQLTIDKDASPALKELYASNAVNLEDKDPHALYPTSVYRQCAGHISSSLDSKVIEGVMSTTITTTVEIVRDVLNPESRHLRDINKPLGRCVTVIDERVDRLYGKEFDGYFSSNNIKLEKLVYRCMEVDKDITNVQEILVDLKTLGVSRDEAVLIVGGGVMADIGGFACALYHRNTPYVMLCTSIVSGIDAGPSPRTCCDALGYKNAFGSYHPPILTLTDRSFFKTLHIGWIRHGLAEIIKMACTKDSSLFELLEAAGNSIVDTKLGIENCESGSTVDVQSEDIIAKAMDCYVRAEYGNLWETHQCRPHAYGHTWSPGYELQAGLLHGHAVSIGMGFGAYLSFKEDWITEEDMHRIFKVISTVGLSLRHDCLENPDLLWSSQVKMTQKRGGNLCAPVPKGEIGSCGYINELSRPMLEQRLKEYQEIVMAYPRNGLGIEPHCADVGLEDPSTVKQHADNAVAKGSLSNGCSHEPVNQMVSKDAPDPDAENIDIYNTWVANKDEAQLKAASSTLHAQVSSEQQADTPEPPKFDAFSLFQDGAEEYASAMTTVPTQDYVRIAEETSKHELFAPCMVGSIEGQFLKMMAQIKGAHKVLDVGTFTGYSALAFADGMNESGKVVTIEADAKTAQVARQCFATAENGSKIELIEADAKSAMEGLAAKGEKYDIIFLDADKVNYKQYYDIGLGMLEKDGILMADNALCSLVYKEGDPACKPLHEFAQYVRSDKRVEQVMLTVREGILIVRKV